MKKDISKFFSYNNLTRPKDRKTGRRTNGLYLSVSSKCNLNCTYCFLKKDKSYIEADKKCRQALIDGSYVDNILKGLERINYDKTTFDRLELWGGETTLHFDIFDKPLFKILQKFPNITRMFFSTNGTFNINTMTSFLDKVDENVGRDFKISFQFSMDGPPDILKRTRNLDYNIIRNNLTQLIQYYNTKKLKHINLEFYYKATLPWDIFKEIFSTREGIYRYCDFFEEELKYFQSINLNKDVNFIRGGYPNCAIPYAYTVEDGLELGRIARLFDTCDFSKYKNYDYDTNFAYMLFKEELKVDPYRQSTICGMNYSSFLFRYDGSLLPCTSAIMDDNKEHIKNTEKEFPEEYKLLQNIDFENYVINLITATDEEIYDFFYKAYWMWEGQANILAHNISAILYYMSLAGQVSPIYAQNKEVLIRHSRYLVPRVGCYYNDVKLNGSPFIPMMDALKFYCNGHLEYFDNRKAMGMLQFFKGREKWETDTSDI